MKSNHGVALEEALQVVLKSLTKVAGAAEQVSLADCLGRVAAVDILAGEDLPPFNRAAVDGFAVNSVDVSQASPESPVALRLKGRVLMGQHAGMALQRGESVAIPTGGMLPSGTDSVVMLQAGFCSENDTLLVKAAVEPDENVIVRGEDFAKDSLVLQQGHLISPQVIGAMAACGYSRVMVSKKPQVAIISTGDEVVDVDSPVGAGQIRDVNSYSLAAVLEQAGCTVRRCGIVPDHYDLLQAALGKALAASDIVLISGGSSAGTRDNTVKVIQSFDEQGLLLERIAVNPGKLTIFAIVGTVPVFALPGHPVAAMTVCNALVKPAVAALLGREQPEAVHRILARLTRSVASVMGRDDFIRVRLVRRGGDYWAEPIVGKPGLISTLLKADGIVHISEVKSGLYGEEWVEVELLN